MKRNQSVLPLEGHQSEAPLAWLSRHHTATEAGLREGDWGKGCRKGRGWQAWKTLHVLLPAHKRIKPLFPCLYRGRKSVWLGALEKRLRKFPTDPDVIWTRNLLIWSQTRYHCATEPCCICIKNKGTKPSRPGTLYHKDFAAIST